MKKLLASFLLLLSLFGLSAPAMAQNAEGVWIQVAARPSLTEAEAEARAFAARLPDVSGYALGGGWYGIVLGPYARPDAEQVLQVYRTEGQIPRDSFITFTANLRTKFYPIGNEPTAPVAPPLAPVAEPAPTVDPAEEPAVVALPDETPAQARASERALTREQRMELQVALKAAGFYTSTIDGAFGRGTRRSMGEWQTARGYEATGILTTAQRKALMDEYNAPLISSGMTQYVDDRAGIALEIPANFVTFDRYDAPFAHFKGTGELEGAQLLLISQPGERRTLYGLFEIMQTLEIVPLEGPRKRSGNSFTLEGRNDQIVSYSEATLANGEIKGFTLIWPAGDEARRARVLAAMQASFRRLDGVLDADAGLDTAQSVDLISGLEVRKPILSRSGFFLNDAGLVATSADVVAGCSRITLDQDFEAEVALTDPALGLAILKPAQSLAPMGHAELANTSPALRSELAVSGFSYGGVLGAPSLTWGQLDALNGLAGEDTLARLQLTAQDGDAGGPLLDRDGAVQGMLLPVENGATTLPQGVRFALKADAIRSALTNAGFAANGADAQSTRLPIAQLQRKADGLTTLVSCWE
ncbi:His-Xaa-Ser repeat protein HxsA [Tritonibacter multivorans]|uniref:His-Xaa-Ser repeat protein HxsA n=1 Tax=Tritonibacter multivorans TaxID=928856 RepID=A0A0P1GIU3_9RHOB|nr:serine protease [Tritonibacter multivorans]MDA7419432.1 serine protease [Tritonibacter multivorans]CUH75450.1 His-Xaa-Ser repeat protein HxsA [Tritonibacter multivorans]SFC67434.1 Sporulation related domain-containing protein [Tritonibacter multivorans]